ncbi:MULTISPECIES: DUF262 domain-containing protein [Actinomycetes]|uniref:DUF262 domain-containing protein n=1 Tax=Actinomycetes TaxID=1760 RepID=UPI0009DF6D4F
MQAQEVTLLRLIEGSKQFQIPLYQRTYSWGPKELDRLWEDVHALTDQDEGSHQSGAHFFGSVVLAPSPRAVAGGVQQWLVIDGQQRLTTIMLALAALRDRANDLGEVKLAEKLHEQCLVNRLKTVQISTACFQRRLTDRRIPPLSIRRSCPLMAAWRRPTDSLRKNFRTLMRKC